MTPSFSTLSLLDSVKKVKCTWDTEAVDWVKGNVSAEVAGVASVPESMVKPADRLSRDTKEEEGRERSHLPFR